MSKAHRTIENRLAAYRVQLDEALGQNPAPSAISARATPPNAAMVVGFDDLEQRWSATVSNQWRFAVAAACLVLIVGSGLLLLASRADPSTLVSPRPDDVAPTACAPRVGVADVGVPAPELDFDNPDFMVALPAGTPPRELAVRALLNPVAGANCIAYDPDEITTSFDRSDNTVSATVKPPVAGRDFDVQLAVAFTTAAVGVTRIDGSTAFSIDRSDPVATLHFSDPLPAAAAIVEVRFRVGDDVDSIRVPVRNADSILLSDTNGSAEPAGDLVWVSYVIQDDAGRPIDAGGSIVS